MFFQQSPSGYLPDLQYFFVLAKMLFFNIVGCLLKKYFQPQ